MIGYRKYHKKLRQSWKFEHFKEFKISLLCVLLLPFLVRHENTPSRVIKTVFVGICISSFAPFPH